MRNTANKPDSKILRSRAEELLKQKLQKANIHHPEEDNLKLIHELEVHQVELELQNEELVETRSKAQDLAEKYRELYDFAPFGYVTISPTNKILRLNHACARMLGKDRSKLLNSDFSFFVAESKRKVFASFLQRIFEHNISETCTISLVVQGRSTITVHMQGVVSETSKECFITIVDITAQQQALEQVEMLNRKNSLILEAAGEGIIGLDLEGNHTFVNLKAAEILGFDVSDLMGESSHAIFHHHHKDGRLYPADECPIYKTLTTGMPAEGETFFWRKDGTNFPVEFSCLPIVDDFRITGAVVTFRDITLRKQMEETMRSEERYRTVTQSANAAIITIDSKGLIIDWNRYAEKIFGYTTDEIINSPLTKLIPDRYIESYIYGFDRMPQGQTPYLESYINGFDRILQGKTTHDASKTVEVHGLHKSGSEIPIELSMAAWETASGKFMTGIMRDITERKHTELELIEAKEKAVESDHLKSAFLANMSHEIRTPMNAILGFTYLLKNSKLNAETSAKYLDIIENGGARLLNIINDIVDISKIESGQMETSISDSNVNEQIEHTYNLLKPEVDQKGMQFYIKPGLPTNKAIIKTDRNKIDAVLINLVKNAIKYCDSGSIEFGYEKKGQFLEFYVKDSGIGIAKDKQEAIFDRFVQADVSDTRAFQGTGLGLSISKAYIEMLGGKIWLESELGKGSVFYFTIPYNAVSTLESAKVKPASEGKKNKVKNLKILIAEDDTVSTILLSEMVKTYSCEMLFAKTGVEVVDACRNISDIDLILMDVKMPVIDGYEATRQIRRFNTEVIIIAQTAYELFNEKGKAMAAGCNEYISKPISPADLTMLIEKHFSNR